MPRILTILCLATSVILSLPEYHFDRGVIVNGLSEASNYLFGTRFGIASIRPNLVSMLCALLVIVPLFRKKYISLDSKTDIIITILDWLFVASFTSCLVSNETKDFGFLQISPMLVVGIILFFAIRRNVRSLILIGFCLLCVVSQVSYVSHAMGLLGALYVLFGGIGIGLQAKEMEE